MALEPESAMSNSRRYGAEIRLRVAETNATALLQATNTSEMDNGLVQELLERCKSDKRNIQLYLNNALEVAEDAVENVEEVFAVMDSISVAIEVAENALEQVPSTPPPTVGEVPYRTIDTLIENRDIFSMICLLRSTTPEVHTKAAFGLLNFVRESESMRNEIRSSGGLPASLVLFTTWTNLKVVAGMMVGLLLTTSSMPSKNPLGYVLRITDCLRYLGNTTARAITCLNDASTLAAVSRGDTIEAAINGLTILWEFVIDYSVVQDQSTSHSGPLEALLEKHSEDQVTLELCLVKASVNGWEEKEMVTAQKLLADSFDDMESLIGTIEASSVPSDHAETTLSAAGGRPLERATTDTTCCEETVRTLIDQRDVLSLLCMLRANKECRTIAALALMKFAKEEELLRNEILSCGGIDAFSRLCQRNSLSRELKVVASMAIAYLVPSFVVGVQANPTNAFSIVECLQYLVSGTTEEASTIIVRDTFITREMMMQAATNGIYLLWTQVVEPLILSGSTTYPRMSDASSIHPASVDSLTVVVDGAQVGDEYIDDDEEEPNQEDVERQQLMEAALNLMAQLQMDPTGTFSADLRYHLDGRRSSFQQNTAGQ